MSVHASWGIATAQQVDKASLHGPGKGLVTKDTCALPATSSQHCPLQLSIVGCCSHKQRAYTLEASCF